MTPRGSDPTGAFTGGGAAGLEDEEGNAPDEGGRSETPGVDQTERDVVTSGIAQTSEVADRDAQEDAEGTGDGTPLPE